MADFTKEEIIELLNLKADDDGVITNLSKDKGLYDFLRRKYINGNDFQRDLVEFVRVNCGKLLYINGYNEKDYFKHIIEKRHYYEFDLNERLPKVIDKKKIKEKFSKLNTTTGLLELTKFNKFFDKISDYVSRSEYCKQKGYNSERYLENECGYLLKTNLHYGENTAEIASFLAGFADKNGCLDGFRKNKDLYKNLSKKLKHVYKPENLVEELPVLEQFVLNETNMYFSNIFQKVDVVQNLFENLYELFPDKKVDRLSVVYPKLYNKLRYARDVLQPYSTLKEFVEQNEDFGFKYVGGGLEYKGRVIGDDKLRIIFTAKSKKSIAERVKKHHKLILNNARMKGVSLNEYLNTVLNVDYQEKTNRVSHCLKREKIVFSPLQNKSISMVR